MKTGYWKKNEIHNLSLRNSTAAHLVLIDVVILSQIQSKLNQKAEAQLPCWLIFATEMLRNVHFSGNHWFCFPPSLQFSLSPLIIPLTLCPSRFLDVYFIGMSALLPPWRSCNAVQGGCGVLSFRPYILFILIQLSHKTVYVQRGKNDTLSPIKRKNWNVQHLCLHNALLSRSWYSNWKWKSNLLLHKCLQLI